ncbi:MAG: hypothetical protein WKG06_46715 [Segetibacter sp.]
MRLFSGNSDANFDLEDFVNILTRLGLKKEKQAEATGYSQYRE